MGLEQLRNVCKKIDLLLAEHFKLEQQFNSMANELSPKGTWGKPSLSSPGIRELVEARTKILHSFDNKAAFASMNSIVTKITEDLNEANITIHNLEKQIAETESELQIYKEKVQEVTDKMRDNTIRHHIVTEDLNKLTGENVELKKNDSYCGK